MWFCINFFDHAFPYPFVFLAAIINTIVLFLFANRPMLLVPIKWVVQLMVVRRLKKNVKLAKYDVDSVNMWVIALDQAKLDAKMLFWGHLK